MDLHLKKDTPDPRVPKIIGFDCELMNVNPARDDGGASASKAILHEVPGYLANIYNYSHDTGRKFLSGSGASIYRDLDHVELASPECRSAHGFMKCFNGMLGIAREATRAANEGRRKEAKLRAHGNNSDGLGNSWGGHLSLMLSNTAYTWIFSERLQYQLFLASMQVSSIIFSGAGKLGTENGRSPLPFVISQRSCFFEVVSSIETTQHRPLVNTRDERLAGNGFRRLHCIFHDTTLTHTSIVMKAGLMQIYLACIEAELVDFGLCFEEPLAALQSFNSDPTLQAKARLLNGQYVTAVEHQMLLREHIIWRLAEDTEIFIPGLTKLLAMWDQLLTAFREDNQDFLVPRVDWVAKLAIIERAATARGLDLNHPSLKALDFAWSDLENGIYFDLECSGAVKTLATPEEITRAAEEAPEDTRAYPRSRLIRAFGGRNGVSIDWNKVVVGRGTGKRAVVNLPDPGAGRQVFGNLDGLTDRELVDRLGVQIEPDGWNFKALNTNK